MSERARAQRTVFGLELRAWMTGGIAFVIGVLLGLPWIGSVQLKIN